MKFLKLLLVVSALNLVSCLDAEIHAPDDSVSELCKVGNYGGTVIRCINSAGQLQSQNTSKIGLESRALFVFIEPGDYSSNLALQDETLRAVSSGVDHRFRPILRQVMINLIVGHQKMLLNQVGKKYDLIYYARTNERWTANGFLSAMENVIRNHTTVDMLLAVHGARSNLAINPDLQTLVSDYDLNSIQSKLSVQARSRVRSIFLTACYAQEASSNYRMSISAQLTKVFPNAITYGSKGINYGPVHRDLIAFEYYYRNWNFSSAINLGNYVISKNIKDGQPRQRLSMPVFSVKGQARYMGFKKSRTEIIRIPALALNSTISAMSHAYLNYNQISDAHITSLNKNTAQDSLAKVIFPSPSSGGGGYRWSKYTMMER
jgi:hypothetical protein